MKMDNHKVSSVLTRPAFRCQKLYQGHFQSLSHYVQLISDILKVILWRKVRPLETCIHLITGYLQN